MALLELCVVSEQEHHKQPANGVSNQFGMIWVQTWSLDSIHHLAPFIKPTHYPISTTCDVIKP